MITGRTRVFTILAHPSEHVTAPLIFNHIFSEMDLDMVYLAHDIRPESLPDTVRSFTGWCNLGGFNVTVPHKEEVAGLVETLCEVSARIGVVNTVVRHEDGELTGFNTDGLGAMGALGRVEGCACMVIGAGGAARAIVDGLLIAGAGHVYILNRTEEHAQRLCALFGTDRVSTYGREPLRDISVVVQATPVADRIPQGLDLKECARGTRLLETVMRPTVLSDAAVRHGLRLIPGHAMLYHQTARNFQLLTGLELPKRFLDNAFASIGYRLP